MDNKPTCHFCKQEAAARLMIDSQNILHQTISTIGYKTMRVSVCKACGTYWDTELTKIVEIHNSGVTTLFDLLLKNKGAPKEVKNEPKLASEVRSNS